MKIAVSSEGKTLNSEVSAVFGRAPYFLIIEDNKLIRVIENVNVEKLGGAGVSTAQMIAQENVDAVITGNMGPRAGDVLRQFDIKVILKKGLVSEAIKWGG